MEIGVAPHYLTWYLRDLREEQDDKEKDSWLLSLTYDLTFGEIFKQMEKHNVNNAIFFSNMSDEIWKERFALGMKDGTKYGKYASKKQRFCSASEKKFKDIEGNGI